MARFNFEDVDKYGSSGGGTGFFKLADDGDVATVRFLYNSADDIEGYSVHEIPSESGSKKATYVNCIREYNQPISDCPFCRERMPVKSKLFVPLYNEDAEKVQVWERGRKFFTQISSICSRYGKHPIVSQTFDIERVGEKGSTSTVYNIYRTDEPADELELSNFEMPEILGSKILDKTAEDMEYYLESGSFPPEDSELPTRRRASRKEETEDSRPARRSRRTPANSDEEF